MCTGQADVEAMREQIAKEMRAAVEKDLAAALEDSFDDDMVRACRHVAVKKYLYLLSCLIFSQTCGRGCPPTSALRQPEKSLRALFVQSSQSGQ
jgi:hypothetical protein